MAYSQKVIDRFENVLKNPTKHSVGRFDPKDPDIATGLAGAPDHDTSQIQERIQELIARRDANELIARQNEF